MPIEELPDDYLAWLRTARWSSRLDPKLREEIEMESIAREAMAEMNAHAHLWPLVEGLLETWRRDLMVEFHSRVVRPVDPMMVVNAAFDALQARLLAADLIGPPANEEEMESLTADV